MNDNRSAPIVRAARIEHLAREYGAQAEADRRLPQPVVDAFVTEGLFRIPIPKSFGGEGATAREQIEVLELISAADGAAGWNLMIGMENFGLIVPGMTSCRELVEDPTVVLASSTAAVGEAVKVDGGYRVSGQWQFVSGCHSAQLFGATVRLLADGEPVLPPGVTRYALIPEGEFEILDTWYVSGLRGSGSHDVRVQEVFVPENRIVAPIGGVTSGKGDVDPLVGFPVGARLSYNKVAVALGIARSALVAFVDLAEGKVPRFTSTRLRETHHAQVAIAEAQVMVTRGRAALFEQVDAMWSAVCRQEHVSTRQRALFQLVCSDTVRGCVAAVELVAKAAGTSANRLDHPLEKLLRDVRVVAQHLTVAEKQISDTGRVLLGLDPQSPLLAGANR